MACHVRHRFLNLTIFSKISKTILKLKKTTGACKETKTILSVILSDPVITAYKFLSSFYLSTTITEHTDGQPDKNNTA